MTIRRITCHLLVGALSLSSLLGPTLGWNEPRAARAQAVPDGPLAATVLSGIATVSTASLHTCALTTSGGVKCWGDNSYGQLGDGTTIPRGAPVDVVGLTGGVTAISVGQYHSCALTTGGGVKCWGGSGIYGELGNGSLASSAVPVDVSGLTSGAIAIAAGAVHTCALTAGGGVKCWGANYYGQVGDGSTVDRSTPVNVVGLGSGIAAISAAVTHTCVLTTGGGVKCWGENTWGELGDGTTVNRLTPVNVSSLSSGVAAVTTKGGHTCARMESQTVKCWGLNSHGELGDGTTTNRSTVVDVVGLPIDVSQIVAGESHTCALANGGLHCWGGNASGQLGDGSLVDHVAPAPVLDLASGVALASAGSQHNCVVLEAGTVKCWGSNGSGQLGDGTAVFQALPANVIGLAGDESVIAAGSFSGCALSATVGLACWGSGLHDGAPAPQATSVSGLASGVASFGQGTGHNCVVTSGGGVKCWGSNSFGELGDGTTVKRSTPADVSGLTSGVSMVTVGLNHSCALTTLGGVQCWGDNAFGQLGDGTTSDHVTPTAVSGLTSGVTAIVSSWYFNCALLSGGGVKCWGFNHRGQLGDGTTLDRYTPVAVSGLASGATAVTVGTSHACARTLGGGVKCWGYNAEGQLGDGTTTDRPTPVSVGGLTSSVSAVSAGGNFTCALTTSTGVVCWGHNNAGQLGDGTLVSRSTPASVSGLSRGVAQISAGGGHACAQMTTHVVKCWGRDGAAQLGIGTITRRLAPVYVIAEADATATLDFAYAQPGSVLTLNARNFPGGRLPTITINGRSLIGSFITNPTGGLIIFLNTTGLSRGRYLIKISVNPTASVAFTLDDGAPLYAQSGDGTVAALDGLGIEPLSVLYLPSLQH